VTTTKPLIIEYLGTPLVNTGLWQLHFLFIFFLFLFVFCFLFFYDASNASSAFSKNPMIEALFLL